MTTYWHKDAGGQVVDTAPSLQVPDLSHLHTHSENRAADPYAVPVPRRATLTQPLVHLERELATAANVQEAVYALLRTLDSLLEPALSCVVLLGEAPESEGYLIARFKGRSTTQPLGAGAIKAPAPRTGKQAEWINWIRSWWVSPAEAADYLGRNAIWLPLRVEERDAGSALLWPESRRTWPAADLQAAYLALALTSSALHRLSLEVTIQALQQQLLESQARVAEAQQSATRSERLASIGQVVSNVAHELNNPLTSIIGHAELLQDAEVEDQTKASVTIIHDQAQHCRRIAQSLLGVVRSSSRSPSPIALGQVIQDTARLMARGLEIDGVDTSLRVETPMPDVLGDPHHLQQVLVNLVKNAQEAMVSAGRGSTIYITANVTEQNGRPIAQVVVEDDGPGIPADIRKRIFEPYFTTKQDRGTGLGLSISKQLMLDMGGDLWLDDGTSPGTRFIMYLPVATEKCPDTIPSAFSSGDEDITQQQRCGETLIIEDDENLADLVERALADTCHTVTRATDGDEALRQIAQHDYDLILLDLRMPKSGGKRTYESLQSRYPHLLSRLIFTTGDVANVETRRWLESTGRPVLEKPFDLSQLRRLAGQFLHAGS